ncbi:isochorismatase family protein [Kosakonia sp. CFBP8986]|uniref:isochorismatase family protein n=1 Tax=Kosakonia sp. CFBP8986 TaxID=3096524 RepID=UPI002A69C4D4|nr:isochorismatase family protein [Kosakonia sp. CFBP8986]MDY0888942.1 isochorismatase family protein [Kosakonia sp. CFBP8986]
MVAQRVVMVVDMQNGVFATPRHQRAQCVARINQLTAVAETVIFIQHAEAGGLEEGSEGFALLPELTQPASAFYVTKTACDAFYKTGLEALLREWAIESFVICGCATDYCVDTTLKNGASKGFAITVAEDAHTTADRAAAKATTLIDHYNEVWRTLIVPDNPVQVKSVDTIVYDWQSH